MKQVKNTLAYWITYLFNFRKLRFFKKVNAKLEQSIQDRHVDRIILKGRILKMTRKYLRFDADSKYIPKERRNKTEIRERILAEFGPDMNRLGIKITANLDLV